MAIQAYADKVKLAQNLIDKYLGNEISSELSQTSLFNEAGYEVSQNYEIEADKVGRLSLTVLDIAAIESNGSVRLGIVVNRDYSLFNDGTNFEIVRNNSLSFGYKRGAI